MRTILRERHQFFSIRNMKTSKDSRNENFSLEWSPYPPEPLIRPDKKRERTRDLKRRLVPGSGKDERELKKG